MTAEDILQRLREVVEGDWTEDTFRGNFDPPLSELYDLAQKNGLKPDEYEQWIQIGLELMMKGISLLEEHSTSMLFPGFLAVMGYPGTIERPWVIDSFLNTSGDSEWLEKFSISLDFYHRFFEQVKNPEEKPLYFDFCTAFIGEGNNRMRGGCIIVTNQRLISIGADLVKTTEFKHRYDIFYPDLQEKAYYGSLDYVDLDNITHVENRYGRFTKQIELELREIEWIKTSPRHFYGPLFFKKQLSDKVKVGKGGFRLSLKPSPAKGFDKRGKERQQRLYHEILSARDALK
ncbi:MAG: hypothetical protein ACXADL_11865 [Candidatus Thorarchaeota archaeon]|jgi:hypothetical protein